MSLKTATWVLPAVWTAGTVVLLIWFESTVPAGDAEQGGFGALAIVLLGAIGLGVLLAGLGAAWWHAWRMGARRPAPVKGLEFLRRPDD